MKTLLLSAAAALTLAGPVLASNTAEFAIQHFAQDREGGDGPRVLIPAASDVTLSTSNSDTASFAAEKLDNNERGFK